MRRTGLFLKYVTLFVGLVTAVLVINDVLDLYFVYQENKRASIEVQSEKAENAAQRLKAAGADWVLLAGKPGDRESALRAAGVDQFIYAGQNALNEIETLHAALGVK